jgi:phage protein D
VTTADTNLELSFVEVLVNGQQQFDMVRNNLVDVTVEQDLFLPAACTLRVLDIKDNASQSAEGYFTILDADTLAIGATLKIRLGHEEAPVEVFDGEITAVELEVSNDAYPVLVVRAYDKSHRMRRQRKTKAFVNVSDQDMARTIAQGYGLTLVGTATNIVYPHVLQDNLTDWDFLRNRAARIGFDMYVEAQKLYFRPIGTDTTVVDAKLGDTLHRARVRMTAQSQVSQVQVQGWDVTSKAPIVATATTATNPAQLGERKTGAQMASSMGVGKYVLAEHVVENQSDAQKVAKAAYDLVAGDFMQVEGVCSGTATLRPGRMINLQGIGRRLSGKYYVTAVTHRRRRGESYVSSFVVNGRRPSTLAGSIAPPDGPDASASNGHRHPSVVVGVVTDIKDADGLGRAKVKFPWLDGTSPSSAEGVSSTWARVATPMAGASRGLAWLPEVNDEVLVAFEHGDINRPFIVGALWNGQDKPPDPDDNLKLVNPQGKVDRRLFKTRLGHTFLFDDSTTSPSVTLKTKDGHTVKLDDLASSASLLLKTKSGHTIKLDDAAASLAINIIDKTSNNSIKINSLTNAIDIKSSGTMNLETTGALSIKGATVTLEASGQFTVKSNGMGTVQAAGPLTVKGAVVQIN